MTSHLRKLVALAGVALLLAGCDLVAMLDEQGKVDAKREAEGRAVGSACRHSGRALEECYERSPKTSKAAIFAGWRDMDAYMRENNISIVLPEGQQEEAHKAQGEEKPKAAEAAPAAQPAPTAQPTPAAAPASSSGKPAKHVV